MLNSVNKMVPHFSIQSYEPYLEPANPSKDSNHCQKWRQCQPSVDSSPNLLPWCSTRKYHRDCSQSWTRPFGGSFLQPSCSRPVASSCISGVPGSVPGCQARVSFDRRSAYGVWNEATIHGGVIAVYLLLGLFCLKVRIFHCNGIQSHQLENTRFV